MNLPPALLFQPTDIHDDSNNIASMSKVLNVLSFLKGDGESDMIQALPDDDDDEEGTTDTKTDTSAATPSTVDPEEDKELEPEPDTSEPLGSSSVEPEPPVEPPVDPTPSRSAPDVSVVSNTPTPAVSVSPTKINENISEVQTEVLKAVNDVINTELSVESKRKLIKILQNQLSAFEEKIMNSSDDQLTSLLSESGLDSSSLQSNARDAVIEHLFKFGRVTSVL